MTTTILLAALIALVTLACGASPALAEHYHTVNKTLLSSTLDIYHGFVLHGCWHFNATSCSERLGTHAFSHDGNDYVIDELLFNDTSRDLYLVTNSAIEDTLGMVLVLGGERYPFADAVLDDDEAAWSSVGLDWSSVTNVQVSLEIHRALTAKDYGVKLSGGGLVTVDGGGYNLAIAESDSSTFSIVLTADPGNATTVTLVKTVYAGSATSSPGHAWDSGAVTIRPSTLTFTPGSTGNWSTPIDVTVAGVPDSDYQAEQLIILVMTEDNNTRQPIAGHITGIYVTVADPCTTCATGGELGIIQIPDETTPSEEQQEEQEELTEEAATISEDEGKPPPPEQQPPPPEQQPPPPEQQPPPPPPENAVPVITLVGSAEMSIPVDSVYTEPGYAAIDPEDGNLTSSVTVTGTVDATQAGTYRLYYDVADSSGSAAVQQVRTVSVVSVSTPEPAPESVDVVKDYDANGDGVIEQQEWLMAIEDYENGLLTNQEIYAISKARG